MDGTILNAHRLDDIGVASVGIGDRATRYVRLVDGIGELAGLEFCPDSQKGQQYCPAQCYSTQHRMQEIDEENIERHPGQIEQSYRPLTSHEGAQSVHVSAAFQCFSRREAKTRHVNAYAMSNWGENTIDLRPNAHQQLRSYDVENALKEIKS